MYFYLRDEIDKPINVLRDINNLDRELVETADGDIKSRLELLPDEKRIEIAKQVYGWNQAKGKYLFEPSEKAYLYYLSTAKIKAIFGGNRCLGEDEMIYDPVHGGHRKISEIDTDFHVYAWDGNKLVVARAMKPFLKGYDHLYVTSLSNGSSFVSTLAHRVLTQSDYTSIGLLRKKEQSLISPRLTNLVSIDSKKLISPKRKPFYDFHVPGYNNYYHAGIIHHNSGKTATTMMEIVMMAEGYHPLQRKNLVQLRKEAKLKWVRDHCDWVLDNRIWIKAPPVKCRVVTVDFPNGCEKICGPEVIKWASEPDIKYDGFANDKKRRIIWKNGSFCEFMTTEQDLDSHGGVARDFIAVDEECPRDYWAENLMRIMTTKGRMAIGMTAIKGITWVKHDIYDEFIKDCERYGIKQEAERTVGAT